MSKQPYIPLYLGDWSRDTDLLTPDAEYGLFKIICKMWESQDRGRLSIGFSQLGILMKKTGEEARQIVQELAETNTLNVQFLDDNRVLLESRRMVRDAAKSLAMSENGKKGGRPKANQKQNESKLKAESKQIPDNDIDIDNVIDNENGIENKKTRAKKIDASALIPASWDRKEFDNLWGQYEQVRTKLKKPMSDASVKHVLGMLKNYAGEDWWKAKASMMVAINKGYLGFYEPKPDELKIYEPVIERDYWGFEIKKQEA